MKLFQTCCKKPQLLLLLMVMSTFIAAFVLGSLWEHRSILKNAGEKFIEICGFDPSELKQSIDQKIIEHNKVFYVDNVPIDDPELIIK